MQSGLKSVQLQIAGRLLVRVTPNGRGVPRLCVRNSSAKKSCDNWKMRLPSASDLTRFGTVFE